ncbi:MAG: ATP-binding protein [Actinomycetota bacterium]
MLAAPERSRRTLARGALAFRWVAIAWMAILALSERGSYTNDALAWASIGAAGAWTAWLTVGGTRWFRTELLTDLALCCWLVVVSGIVVPDGQIATRPLFAVGYPVSAALMWGIARGPIAGIGAGAALSAALLGSRLVNGFDLGDIPNRQWQSMAGTWVQYLAAGGTVGFVSRLLERTAGEAQKATGELVRERERAARLAERESLARQIHDSVLQSLALVHKRGQELAASGAPGAREAAQLAEIAGQQEATLRNLILREPQEGPAGQRSLREALETTSVGVTGVPVGVSAVGPIWIARRHADEIAAAVREALANVAEHANASRATVFADEEGGEIVVTVRDDGVGFTYDEALLRADGKAGMLKSMKGRLEDLGGSMAVTAAPGGGTEIELRAPKVLREEPA